MVVTATPNFETVWAALQELTASQRETDRIIKENQKEIGRQMEETDRRMKETDRRMKETDRRMQETDRRMQETDRIVQENALQMKETDRRLKETERLVKETDRLVKETALQMKETDRRMKRTDTQLGGLHNSFGELAEHLVAPGVVERFNEQGFHFDAIAERGLKFFDKKGNIRAEIDILLENSTCIIVVEVKSSPKVDKKDNDIEHHKKRLSILREHRPRDKRKILGAIAGAVFKKGVKEAIIAAGFYVLEQSGDTMEIYIPEGFKPSEW